MCMYICTRAKCVVKCNSPSPRLHHNKALLAPYVRTVAHKSSFFIDIIPLWKSRPSVTVNSPSSSSFKSRSSSILLQGVCLARFILVFVFILCLSLLHILLSLLYKSCTLVVPFMPAYLFAVCFCISYHHLIILYIVFVQILTLICSVLFAYLLAVFFIVQIHYASSCFVVRFCFVVCFRFVVYFFSFVGRTPELADCATVQPLWSSCALKFPYIKKKK